MPEGNAGSDLILSERDKKRRNSFGNLLDRIPHFRTKREKRKQEEEIDRLTKVVVSRVFELMSEEGILTLSRDRTTGELIEEIYQGDINSSDGSHFFALASKRHLEGNDSRETRFLLALTEQGGDKRELQIRQRWESEDFALQFSRTPDKPLESMINLGGTDFYIPPALTFDEKRDFLRSLLDPKINTAETHRRYQRELERANSEDPQRPRINEVLWANV